MVNFDADNRTGPAPLTVHFTDSSSGSPTAWAWDFNNDGTIDSTEQNPVHTYTAPGTYQVNLTATNAGGSAYRLKGNFIQATEPGDVNPVVDFSADSRNGIAPFTVHFTDLTITNPTAWAWDFNNDGVIDDTTQNPVHTYTTSGTYQVNLTATNATGTASRLKANFITVTDSVPPLDTLFNGTITLTSGETFTKQAYNNATGGLYTVNRTTPLGALDKVATLQGFSYEVTDKRWSYDQVLLLDNVSVYTKSSGGKWYAYVNGVYKDGFGNHANGLNVLALSDNDQVNFFYSSGTNLTAPTDATAAVKILVHIQAPGPVVDTLYDGTVTLIPGETFTKVAYNNATSGLYTINTTTPFGALNAAGLSFKISDKNFWTQGYFLLDGIGSYDYNKTAGKTWICQVNGVTLDDYGFPSTDGLNIKTVANGDHVNFYYGVKPVTPQNAIAVALITVSTGGEPSTDYSLSMKGKVNRIITKAQFEEALACVPSGHNVTWTDTNGSVWGGIPLWVLVGMIDDEESSGHYTFNDALATQGYTVKVKAADWDTSLASADIARDSGYLVVNTLNGTALPTITPGGKPCWPLMLKGSSVFGGQQVGGINEIELVGLPQPAAGWTLTMEGDVTDIITQQYFEQAIVCHHNVTYTDAGGSVWTGVPLWDLVGSVDDIESSSHWTFNDTRATGGYTVRVMAVPITTGPSRARL